MRKEISDENPPAFSFFVEQFETKNREINDKSQKNTDGVLLAIDGIAIGRLVGYDITAGDSGGRQQSG
ncbi:MAG: hypothetical protein ACLPVI_02995 [Dehalococcoidales bacterium]